MESGWVVLLPQIFLAGGGLLVFCAGALFQRPSSGLPFVAAVVSTVLCGTAAAFVEPSDPRFLGMVDGSGYARFFTALISLITLLSLLFSRRYTLSTNISGDEYHGVMLCAALGMVLTVGALHWAVFFLGLELLSISLYVLIASRRDESVAVEAAVKYFVMGSVASGFLIFGIAVIYAVTGKLGIGQSLGGPLSSGDVPGLLLGLGLILVGVGFKISIVPFHLWTPDVYQGAPAPVTAFLSTGSKVALISFLLRLALQADQSLWTVLVPVLWVAAAMTMTVGNITAMAQTHLKRLLAYSSIAQMGYILMALLAARETGAAAVMYYASIYALMDLGAFGTIALLSAEGSDLDELEDYRGLGCTHPLRTALSAVCLFSLAGLPPAAGFAGKFILFQATIQAGFAVLAVIGILTAIASVYYYLRVVVVLYMRSGERFISLPNAEFAGDLGSGAVFLLLVFLGILPTPLLSLLSRIVASFAA